MSELYIKKVMEYKIDNPQYKNNFKLVEYSNGNVFIVEYWYDKELKENMSDTINISKRLLSKLFSARECMELWGSKQKYHKMDDLNFGDELNEQKE